VRVRGVDLFCKRQWKVSSSRKYFTVAIAENLQIFNDGGLTMANFVFVLHQLSYVNLGKKPKKMIAIVPPSVL
jgi:hypothetical protein